MYCRYAVEILIRLTVPLRQVFDEVQPMVASALEGYRVCVFAYGQTGSGKTYTMEGPKADRWAMTEGGSDELL